MTSFKTKEFGEKQYAIEITEGEFVGVEYVYGEVKFPDENEPILSFQYDIISVKKPENQENFKTVIGDILVGILKDSIENQSVVYKGGIN